MRNEPMRRNELPETCFSHSAVQRAAYYHPVR